MRKSLIILLCLSMSYSLMAQETVKQKEIGLVFSDLNSFGISYKTGTNKSLWRFNTMAISGSNMNNTRDSLSSEQTSTGFSISLGKEFRKNIVDNLELRFGADLSFKYNQSKSNYDDKTVNNNDGYNESTTYSPGINLVFGFNYVINEKIVLGIELLPSINYVTGTSISENNSNNNQTKSDLSGFNYGLSNTSGLLTIAYRF